MNPKEKELSDSEKQDEEWQRFVDTLSHELKTPLTSIIAAAGLLAEELETKGEESYQRLIKNIIHNTRTLEAKVVELLEVIKTGGGGLRLKLEPVDIKSLLKGISWQINPVVQSSGKHFYLDLPDSLPLVNGDGRRLEQVVLHLITNATKFAPEGSEIILRARKRDSSLIIEVQNSGPGISREEQAKLFKPYSRLSADRRGKPGLGLGLALAKQVIELHEGRIWVESEEGKGSTFALSLPLQAKQ